MGSRLEPSWSKKGQEMIAGVRLKVSNFSYITFKNPDAEDIPNTNYVRISWWEEEGPMQQ